MVAKQNAINTRVNQENIDVHANILKNTQNNIRIIIQ